jgi:hypothetical protein
MKIKNETIMKPEFKDAIVGLLKRELPVALSLDLITSIDEINNRNAVIEKQKVLLLEKHVKKDANGVFLEDKNGPIYKSAEDKVKMEASYLELGKQTFDITLKEKIKVSKSKDRMSAVDITVLRDEFIEIVD